MKYHFLGIWVIHACAACIYLIIIIIIIIINMGQFLRKLPMFRVIKMLLV